MISPTPDSSSAVTGTPFLQCRLCLFFNFLLFDIWKVRGEAQSRRHFLEKQKFVDKCWSSSFLLEKLVKMCIPIPKQDSPFIPLLAKAESFFPSCCRLIPVWGPLGKSFCSHKFLSSATPCQLRRLSCLSGHSVAVINTVHQIVFPGHMVLMLHPLPQLKWPCDLLWPMRCELSDRCNKSQCAIFQVLFCHFPSPNPLHPALAK